MPEVRVVIPDETYGIVKFRQDDLPGVAVINKSLVGFASREVFRWHLSIMVHFEEIIDNGMPAQADVGLVDRFGDQLDQELKVDSERPNALFLGRVTWNETRELIYRVYDPEVTNDLLQRIVSDRTHPREFDYRIDDDPDWGLAEWHLNACAPA